MYVKQVQDKEHPAYCDECQEGCLDCNEYDTCMQCEDSFSLFEGLCIQCPDKC